MDPRDAVFNVVYEIVSKDKNVIVLTDDMSALVLDKIQADFPNQVINIGIAEQNLMSVAGGLALAGKCVFAYGIASHVTRRCYEQISLDICSMNLHVIIIGVGSGLSYGWDGLTHHSNYDLAYMRAIPRLTIYNPSDPNAAAAVVTQAYQNAGPSYIRLDKDPLKSIYEKDFDFSSGVATAAEGGQVAIVATGNMVHRALEVSALMKESGVGAKVVDLFRIKPPDKEALLNMLRGHTVVASLEEHSEVGGIGDILASLIAEANIVVRFKKFSMGDQFFIGSANRSWVHDRTGLAAEAIALDLRELLSAKS